MASKHLFVGALLVVAGTAALAMRQEPQQRIPDKAQFSSPKRKDKVVLTDAQWKKRLTPAQYKILRADGTEAAFCGKFHDNHLNGTYLCAGCGLELFSSDNKFDSGTGWPSFYQPVSMENVWFKKDNSWGMQRIEVRCARCDGHLGHVFDDAANTPTGQRYCINSDGLTFKKR